MSKTLKANVVWIIPTICPLRDRNSPGTRHPPPWNIHTFSIRPAWLCRKRARRRSCLERDGFRCSIKQHDLGPQANTNIWKTSDLLNFMAYYNRIFTLPIFLKIQITPQKNIDTELSVVSQDCVADFRFSMNVCG